MLVEILSVKVYISAILVNYIIYLITLHRLAEGETIILFSIIIEEPTWLLKYLEDFANVFSEKKAKIL